MWSCVGAGARRQAFFGAGKTEPRPAIAARGERIRLGEFLEQLRLLFGAQADASVRDGKLDPIASIRHLAHPQRDAIAELNPNGFALGRISGMTH
jgi:hypothetical protein